MSLPNNAFAQTGNVGVGVSSPTTKLDLSGALVSTTGQWDWKVVTASTNNLNVTASIPNVGALTTTASSLRLVGWNGTQWVDLSGSAAVANASGYTENNTLSGIVPAGTNITAIGIGLGATCASNAGTLTIH